MSASDGRKSAPVPSSSAETTSSGAALAARQNPSPRPPVSSLRSVGFPGLEDHDLTATTLATVRLDIRLERLRVGLDRGEGVVVAGNSRTGIHQPSGVRGVVAVHRVVPADAYEGHVDLVAL